MAKYRITAPDGKQYNIEGDGTQEEALSHFQSQYAQMQQAQPQEPFVGPTQEQAAPPPPGPTQSLGRYTANAARDTFDAAMQGVGGMIGYPMGAAAGLAGIVGNATGIYPNDPAATEQKVAGAFATTPKNPNSWQSQAVNLPGRLIGGAGEMLSQVPGIKGTPYVESIAKRLPEAAANAVALYGGLKARARANANAPPPTEPPPPTDLQQAAAVLEQNDIPTYKYQVSQNQTLQNAQAAADQLPFSGAKTAVIKQGNAFNRAVLSLAGSEENAMKATPEVMGRLQSKLGANLDLIENNATFPVPAQNIVSVLDDARLVLDDQQFGKIQRQVSKIDQLSAANGGELTGGAFASIKRSLDKLSGGSDPDVGSVARDLRSALQDGLTQALTPDESAFYAKTRSQYQMMKQIEGAIDASGNVSPSKLANVFRQKANRYQGIYGRGEQSLASLARAGSQILPEKIPNSGTPQRLLYTALVGGGAFVNPLATALAVGTGLGIPRLLRSLPSGARPAPIPPPVLPPPIP